ncbi:MAG: hypothetical protein U1F27_03260 [Turneriella sp.]
MDEEIEENLGKNIMSRIWQKLWDGAGKKPIDRAFYIPSTLQLLRNFPLESDYFVKNRRNVAIISFALMIVVWLIGRDRIVLKPMGLDIEISVWGFWIMIFCIFIYEASIACIELRPALIAAKDRRGAIGREYISQIATAKEIEYDCRLRCVKNILEIGHILQNKKLSTETRNIATDEFIENAIQFFNELEWNEIDIALRAKIEEIYHLKWRMRDQRENISSLAEASYVEPRYFARNFLRYAIMYIICLTILTISFFELSGSINFRDLANSLSKGGVCKEK